MELLTGAQKADEGGHSLMKRVVSERRLPKGELEGVKA